MYRPERFRVIKKKRDLRDGVRVSDDLIWEDRQKKKQLRSVMKEAFEAGKMVVTRMDTPKSGIRSETGTE